MQKILRKRVFRDLRENLFRYLALGLLIIFGMYLIVGMVAAADTIIIGTKDAAKEQCVEDGEFTVFAPLSDSESKKLTDQGILLEEHFYLDYELEDDSVLRIFTVRQEIDLARADIGNLPKKKGEILLEKQYAKEHNLTVGDAIKIGGHTFTISGIGSAPDYDAPYRNLSDSAVDSSQFGIAFFTKDDYQMLKSEQKSMKSEEYVYAYLLNQKMSNHKLKEKVKEFKIAADDIDDTYFKEYWDRTGGKLTDFKEGLTKLTDGADELSEGLSNLSDSSASLASVFPELTAGISSAKDGSEKLSDGISEFSDKTTEFLDDNYDIELSKLTQFLTAEDNMRIGAASDDVVINKAAGLLAGVIIIILFAYVISVFVVHTIEKESQVIGTLYALGVKRRDLLAHYLVLPVLVTFIAGVIGTIVGYSSFGVNVQMQETCDYFSIPDLKVLYEPYLLVYGILMPPVTAALTNLLVIRKKLKKPALVLIRNEQKIAKNKNIHLKDKNFVRTFQIRQFLREKRTAFTMFFGMFISLLICMISLNCYVLCEHIKTDFTEDTKYEYMYTYKYPEKKVPKGGEEAYGVTLKKEVLGYNFDVTLLGIKKDNPYFDAPVKKGKNQVLISSAMAQKYDLKAGDDVILKDEEHEQSYAFAIDGIVPYSAGFYAFMDIDSLRELMGEDEDYYNIVFADHALSIDSGRLYATTSKADVKKSASVFVDQMWTMIILLTVVSALIFVVVMYLMLKVMIDRSATSISMMKIFGYRKKEIRKLFLNGNLIVVTISALLGIPLSKMIMNAMYPYMVSNISCGLNLTFDRWMYVGLFVSILVLYFVLTPFLMRSVNKILPAELLKNRE